MLTGSRDRTARLWHVASGKSIGPPLRHPRAVARVTFGLDGKTILTATDDQIAWEWPMPAAVAGTPEHLDRWVQVMTGMELQAEGGIHILDAVEWQKRRQELLNQSELELDHRGSGGLPNGLVGKSP